MSVETDKKGGENLRSNGEQPRLTSGLNTNEKLLDSGEASIYRKRMKYGYAALHLLLNPQDGEADAAVIDDREYLSREEFERLMPGEHVEGFSGLLRVGKLRYSENSKLWESLIGGTKPTVEEMLKYSQISEVGWNMLGGWMCKEENSKEWTPVRDEEVACVMAARRQSDLTPSVVNLRASCRQAGLKTRDLNVITVFIPDGDDGSVHILVPFSKNPQISEKFPKEGVNLLSMGLFY